MEDETLGGITEVGGRQNNHTINHLASFVVDQHNKKEVDLEKFRQVNVYVGIWLYDS
jgi:hypothetical protein